MVDCGERLNNERAHHEKTAQKTPSAFRHAKSDFLLQYGSP